MIMIINNDAYSKGRDKRERHIMKINQEHRHREPSNAVIDRYREPSNSVTDRDRYY
jgi:hypothetical protein